MSLTPGQIVGEKYRVVRQIGEGGMGTVYEAEHTFLDRRVALKVMNPELTEDERAVERFFQEAKAASAIGHPNIIEIFDVGKDDDSTNYFIMELLQGESLEDLLDRQERLSEERAVAIILQTLSALHFAHKNGIIHRDLKPANVFLSIDQRGREVVKLLDFGIAKVKDPTGKAKKLTVPGAMMGTPRYASPEQIKGKGEIDHRIDIWAAGVVLYELIAGECPFEGDNFSEVLSKILVENHTPLRETLPGISLHLSQIADKAMRKNPDERYASVEEMIRELAAYQNEALGMMSGTAAGVIRSSFPPSAPGDETAPFETPSEQTPAQPSAPHERRVTSRWIAASLLALVAVGLVITAMLAYPSGSGAKDDARQHNAPSGNSPQTQPSEVTINITGVPKGAEVTLDGKPVPLPIQVARTEKPAILKITARRYKPHVQAISLATSQEIAVEMEKRGNKRPNKKIR